MTALADAIRLEHSYWYTNAAKYQTRHGWAQAMFRRSSVYYRKAEG